MRCLIPVSTFVAIPLFACASASSTHKWNVESVEQAVDVRGRELERSCEATNCTLVYYVKGEHYVIPLDENCGIEAEICIWRDGLIELYVPDSAASEWRYGGSTYRAKSDLEDKRFIEQYKNGGLYAAYVVDLRDQRVSYVIQEDEICVDAPDGNLLCFNSYPGRHLAFEVQL